MDTEAQVDTESDPVMTHSSSDLTIKYTVVEVYQTIDVMVFLWISFHHFDHRKCTSGFGGPDGKGSPIMSKGRRGVAGLHVNYFSVSRHCDGGAHLISVGTR